MENSPVKQILTPTKVLLAGVFLVAILALPALYRLHQAPNAGNQGGGTIAAIAQTIEQAITNPLSGAFPVSSGTDVTGNGSATAEGAPTAAVSATLPSRLVIPALGINAGIQYVGLTADGNMDTPKSAVDVAWYKLGPVPGGVGNAVIAGHINTRYSAHGVFEHLENLNTGDTVKIVTKGGQTLTFKVTAKELLPYNASSAAVFGKTSGKHLNLITCAGTWQADKHVYDKRLVIFTELVQ